MEVKKLKLSEIVVGERIRTRVQEIQELSNSIEAHGLQSPIVVRQVGEEVHLVAGGRRLMAFDLINKAKPEKGWDEIPVVFYAGEDVVGVELAENLARKDFPWSQKLTGILKWHKEQMILNPRATKEKLAKKLGISTTIYSRDVKVAQALEAKVLDEKEIAECSSVESAKGKVDRKLARRMQVQQSIEAPRMEIDLAKLIGIDTTAAEARLETIHKDSRRERLICGSFQEFVKQHDGRFFDFVHCDFPYGVLDKTRTTDYQDSKDIYFELLHAFIAARHTLLAKAANIMFWYSMKYHQETVDAFTKAGFDVNPFQLVWLKNDSKGRCPDPTKVARHNIETALHIRWGDAKIHKVMDQGFASGRGSIDGHQAAKPTLMLSHFFKMFVDEHTTVLDPTAGGGTVALAAQKAKSVTLVELEMENCTIVKALLHTPIEDMRLPEEVERQNLSMASRRYQDETEEKLQAEDLLEIEKGIVSPSGK